MKITPPADCHKGKPQRTQVRLERWAETHHVELHKILEGSKKTPDYRAIFPDANRTEVIIEMKEITTPFEIENGTVEMRETLSPQGRSSFGDPVRDDIKKARDQLKPYSDLGYPTLLLIGMWTPVLDWSLVWDIPIAMYGGGPEIGLRVENGGPELLITGTARGGRQLADDENRSISGIGRIERRPHESPEKLVVYRHNNPRIAFPMALPGIEWGGG